MAERPRGNAHLESNLERFFVTQVRTAGGYAIKWIPVIAGLPDRIVLLPGGVIAFVELKQRGEKPSAIQAAWHRKFAKLGIPVYVIDGAEQVVPWIDARIKR